ncbi:MAG: hypothetical protein AAFO94_16485, partial [Bacteroidota bacterium]
MKNLTYFLLFVSILLNSGCQQDQTQKTDYQSSWPDSVTRTFLGPEFWANPMQDWQINQGRLECLVSDRNRNVQLLTHQLSQIDGSFSLRVNTGRLTAMDENEPTGWTGFRFGIQGQFDDYRDNAIYGQGLEAGITT